MIRTRDIIEEKLYKRQEPFFPQLTTKHSDTQHFSNINVCDTVDHKLVRERLRNILTLPVGRKDYSNSAEAMVRYNFVYATEYFGTVW